MAEVKRKNFTIKIAQSYKAITNDIFFPTEIQAASCAAWSLLSVHLLCLRNFAVTLKSFRYTSVRQSRPERRVVQSRIRLTRREFWSQFCNFLLRFSVATVCSLVLRLSNLKPHKKNEGKNISISIGKIDASVNLKARVSVNLNRILNNSAQLFRSGIL